MKKLALTIAIVLGLSMTTFADGGGLFHRGENAANGVSGYNYFGTTDMNRGDGLTPMLPAHGQDTITTRLNGSLNGSRPSQSLNSWVSHSCWY